MSKLVGDTLPKEILEAFDGEGLERKLGPAHILVTSDLDGTPRPCMLSAGEILAVSDRLLRFALWPRGTTPANLARGGRALFCYVAPGTVIYVRGHARPFGGADAGGLACFELEVDSVEADDHAGMPVTSGITFAVERGDPADVVDAWRKQLAALRGS